MSDNDLVKRLRKRQEFEFIDGYKRIEWEDDDALEAADRIEALEAKLAKAVEDLKGWLEVSQHCTIEDGVCWCGEDMKNHRNSTNYAHSPVDHGAYVARRLAESTRATLAEIEGDKP